MIKQMDIKNIIEIKYFRIFFYANALIINNIDWEQMRIVLSINEM